VKGRNDPGAAADAGSTRTAEQRRAADALRAVPQVADGDELRKRYRAYVDRLGPSILMNGLGQALATERAAAGTSPTKPDERAHDRLYRNLEAWLCGAGGVYSPAERRDLLAAIVGESEALYVRAQAEALAWLVWHKKFCRAQLPSPEDLPGDGES
jgi:CRISPR-associated protein Cmr5